MGVVNDSKNLSLSVFLETRGLAAGACEHAEDDALVLLTAGGWPADEQEQFRER